MSVLLTLQKLNISNCPATDLSVLSLLPNLDSLTVSDRQLIDPDYLPVLPKLRYLTLIANQISGPLVLPVMPNLEILFLSHYSIADLSPLLAFPKLKYVYIYNPGIRLYPKYFVPQHQWQSQWILEEKNATLRQLLVRVIGYDRICQELAATQLDSWQEYTLLKFELGIEDDFDSRNRSLPTHLLKMTCPSTGKIHIMRVPPTITSAREAIRWVNWEIDPEEFVTQS